MNARTESSSSRNVAGANDRLLGPDLGPALKRERLLQRVRAARKRLPQAPSSTLARLR
jgi:hypothetical protein